MPRIPANQAGTTRKLYDFKCPLCSKTWEDLVSEVEINAGNVKCADDGTVGVRQLSAPRVDSHAASAWRR